MDELIDTEMGLAEVEQSDFALVDALINKGPKNGLSFREAMAGIIAKARIAEREECAKVAARMYAQDAFRFELNAATADAIRNRTPCTPSPTGDSHAD